MPPIQCNVTHLNDILNLSVSFEWVWGFYREIYPYQLTWKVSS